MSRPSSNHDLRRWPRKRPRPSERNTLLAHAEMPREVRSTRSRVGGSGEVRKEFCREIASDVQWLKIAVRASERLERLMASPPPREPGERSISAHEGVY